MGDKRAAQLLEYEKLKDEQRDRIRFRDNLRYANLVAVGALASYASSSNDLAWLLVPWLCSILGWTSIANNIQVKRIGDYIDRELRREIGLGRDVFGWERFRATGWCHRLRQVFQLAVDEATFVAPGLIAILVFLAAGDPPSSWLWAIVAVETLPCVAVGIWIYVYSDVYTWFLAGVKAVMRMRRLRRREAVTPA